MLAPYYHLLSQAFTILVGISISIIGKEWSLPISTPPLHLLNMASRIAVDVNSTMAAATDFGHMIQSVPAAVLHRLSHRDISSVLKLSSSSLQPFPVAVRGQGHSVWGQAMAPPNGIVIDMRSFDRIKHPTIIQYDMIPYVDAGGEQLWREVLDETIKYGLTPRSWTDYLHLTVGGTLSVAGISGQAFKYGPQISNVYELDVITGRGEMMTCSKEKNSDLFFAVLGGLGQFGIITRARIALEPAPLRVKWVRLVYTEFARFARDQEWLVSADRNGFDYVEGSLFVGRNPINSWRSTFFSESDIHHIVTLKNSSQDLPLYLLEASMYYDRTTQGSINQKVESLLKNLDFVPGFMFAKDVTYVSFLDRVHEGEMRLRSKGLWEVPHPWLNIFLPKSRIKDFDSGVFKGILKHQEAKGPILIYPMNRTKWDERMSTVIPEGGEELFYSVGLLRSAMGNWRELQKQNEDILKFCNDVGIKFKQYMPHYKTRGDWVGHFGNKWGLFLERKQRYDPKAILSPGQGIFAPPL